MALRRKILKLVGGSILLLFLVLTKENTMAKENVMAKEDFGEFTELLYAESAVLMDGDSGRILYGKKETEPLPMASTTKIMTCILVLEEGDLEETISVSAYAASMPKVRLGMKEGDRFRVKNLLYSMMLESHNDSAVALAEYIGEKKLGKLQEREGRISASVSESKESVAAFAECMNQKAGQIGCKDTFFVTPNGLDAVVESEENFHHTTAEDLALIMAYCVRRSPAKDIFLEITRADTICFTANQRSYQCRNHNALLQTVSGMLCGKTGFTNQAGYCYVCAVEKEERLFVIVLLACGWPNNKSFKWQDTKKLIQYAEDTFRLCDWKEEKIYQESGMLPALKVQSGQSERIGETAELRLDLLAEEKREDRILLREGESIEKKIYLEKNVHAPVYAGQIMGRIEYCLGEECLRRETIVAKTSVKAIDYLWCFRQIWGCFLPE